MANRTSKFQVLLIYLEDGIQTSSTLHTVACRLPSNFLSVCAMHISLTAVNLGLVRLIHFKSCLYPRAKQCSIVATACWHKDILCEITAVLQLALIRCLVDIHINPTWWTHWATSCSCQCSTTGITGHSMYYPIWWMMHINYPFLLIRKSSPWHGGSNFLFPLSMVLNHMSNAMWSLTICPMPCGP